MALLYRTLRVPAVLGVRCVLRARGEGMEHIPRRGPFILAPNHQSALDPVVVQSFCSRIVSSMTKSTQFASPFFRWLLPRVGAFPVRRYRVDPQAVRVLLRRLRQGEGVCVYPEGERTWDGSLQPFRRGTLHVFLRAGVPVIPVGLDGMYDVWPRWSRRPRVGGASVYVRFGAPLRLGEVRDRERRIRRLPEVERQLRDELLRLSGESARSEDRGEARGSASTGSGPGIGPSRRPGRRRS